MRAGVGDLVYFHRTQQYSITALTDGGGNVTERYAYTAYGTPTILDSAGATLTSSADHNRYTYTGREWDEELELYHCRARMYDAASGRFLSRDPIGFEGSPWNLLEYVRSNPGVYLDPSGEAFQFGIPFLLALTACAATCMNCGFRVYNNQPPPCTGRDVFDCASCGGCAACIMVACPPCEIVAVPAALGGCVILVFM